MGVRRGALGILTTVVVAVLAGAGPAAAETRSPALWPFAATSPWNTSLGSAASFGANTGTTSCTGAVQDEVHDANVPWVNAEQWSEPVYSATTSDPQKTVYKGTTPSSPLPNGTSQGTYRIPNNAAPDPKDDHSLVVVEPGGLVSDEMWAAYNNPLFVNAGNFGRYDLDDGDGFAPLTGSGPRAGGASYLGGLLRTWELQAGSIRHALAIALTTQRMNAGDPIAPATRIDGNHGGYAGPVHMGQRIALPPGSLAGLGLQTAAGTAIAQALQTYGAYVVETGGALALYAEPGAASAVDPARVNSGGDTDMKRIVRALACVTGNGGTALAPPPPPFG